MAKTAPLVLIVDDLEDNRDMYVEATFTGDDHSRSEG